MDFEVDKALAVLLRIAKDRRLAQRYLREFAKLKDTLDQLHDSDPAFQNAVKRRRGEA